MKKNEQKICLVTGANSGIGKEIATGLATSGAHVIMICRNTERGMLAQSEIKKIANSNSIELLIADMSSQTDIRTIAKIIKEKYGKLDVLINNAGLVLVHKTFSVDGIEMTLATNHLGPFLLTNLLVELLKKGTSSRIINISSAIHKWATLDLNDLQYQQRKYQVMKAYAQSKLLMNIVSFELAQQLEGTGVMVNCVHPGAVKTNIGHHSTNHIVLKCLDKIIKFFFISPYQAAKTPLYLAMSPEMTHITGKYIVRGKMAAFKSMAYDPVLAKKVWAISEELTKSR